MTSRKFEYLMTTLHPSARFLLLSPSLCRPKILDPILPRPRVIYGRSLVNTKNLKILECLICLQVRREKEVCWLTYLEDDVTSDAQTKASVFVTFFVVVVVVVAVVYLWKIFCRAHLPKRILLQGNSTLTLLKFINQHLSFVEQQ
jgi:hypothetical protein